MQKDLSKINSRSMVAILEKNSKELFAITTRDDLIKAVEEVFKKEGINTEASRRLILNMSKSNSYVKTLTTLTNSMLAGYGLALND